MSFLLLFIAFHQENWSSWHKEGSLVVPDAVIFIGAFLTTTITVRQHHDCNYVKIIVVRLTKRNDNMIIVITFVIV